MQEQEEHIQEKTANENRSLEVIFLREALEAFGLGREFTEADLENVVKPLVDKEGYYVGNYYLEQIAYLDRMYQLREAAKKSCPTCGSYPFEDTTV